MFVKEGRRPRSNISSNVLKGPSKKICFSKKGVGMDSNLDLQSSNFVLQLGINKKIFPAKDILFFISENHKTFLVTEQGRWAYEQPLREIEKTTPMGFVRIHRNAIINFAFVNRFTNKHPVSVVMDNDEVLPISRSRKTETLLRYEDYLKGKGSLARKIFSVGNSKSSYKAMGIWSLRECHARRAIDGMPDLSLEAKKDLLYIAQTPQAIWLGAWNSDVFSDLEKPIKQAKYSERIPVFVLFKLHMREETYQQELDVNFAENYLAWIKSVANAIGTTPCIIVLEPNALCSLGIRKDQEQSNIIVSLLRNAVQILKQCSNLKLYLDAGHPQWLDAAQISIYLARAGVDFADGFSLNVSNYVSNEENTIYGEKISNYLGGKKFVIDTSRNGDPISSCSEQWVNRAQASLGEKPTLDVDHPLIDGYLWIKPPGESDAECQGQRHKAGEFNVKYAIDLVKNSARMN